MAKDNRLKKGVAVPFDESKLIGKLSGLTRTPAPAPIQQGEPTKPDANPAPQPASPADAAPVEKPAEREGEKGGEAPMASAPAVGPAPEPEPAAASQAVKKPKPGKAKDYGRFLVTTEGKKKAHVYISDENHAKIKQVLSLFGTKVAISDYLENVLAQHWEQYDPEIQERMKQLFMKK